MKALTAAHADARRRQRQFWQARRAPQDRSLRVHGGVATNRSPVNGADMVFTKADLVSWTLGLSGSFGTFQFAAGLNRNGGTADNVTLRDLLSGRAVTSSVDIHSLGFIYSLAYQF